MKERRALSAVLSGKCPRCRKGDVFTHGSLKLLKFSSAHENCPVCGLKYEVEPGFFFGAMYVSYAFSVAIFLASVLGLYVFAEDPDLWVYIVTVTSISAITYPFN
ncbi:MAG: DUF983 domain-containing protein, partial [Bacteroidota bacterium]